MGHEETSPLRPIFRGKMATASKLVKRIHSCPRTRRIGIQGRVARSDNRTHIVLQYCLLRRSRHGSGRCSSQNMWIRDGWQTPPFDDLHRDIIRCFAPTASDAPAASMRLSGERYLPGMRKGRPLRNHDLVFLSPAAAGPRITFLSESQTLIFPHVHQRTWGD